MDGLEYITLGDGSLLRGPAAVTGQRMRAYLLCYQKANMFVMKLEPQEASMEGLRPTHS